MATIVPAAIGTPTLRIDGRAKVTGSARYPSDVAGPDAPPAFLVPRTLPPGRVARFHLAEAPPGPRVLDIPTHEDLAGQVQPPSAPGGKGKATTTLESDIVWHAGQIIAVVIADSYEAAREAAHKVVVRYEPQPPAASFDSPGVTLESAAAANKQSDPQV